MLRGLVVTTHTPSHCLTSAWAWGLYNSKVYKISQVFMTTPASVSQEKVGQKHAVGKALHYSHRCAHPSWLLWCGVPCVYRGVTSGDWFSLRGNNRVSFSQLPIFTKLWRNLPFLSCISSSSDLGGNQLKHLQPVQITCSKVVRK